jgi:putative restriction endonuclease
MDNLGPLNAAPVTGRFPTDLEQALAADPQLLNAAARTLVEAHFPDSVATDLLTTVGLDPDVVLHAGSGAADPARQLRRDPAWRDAVLQAWDRQCAFCGFDGQIFGSTVGLGAAHVRSTSISPVRDEPAVDQIRRRCRGGIPWCNLFACAGRCFAVLRIA